MLIHEQAGGPVTFSKTWYMSQGVFGGIFWITGEVLIHCVQVYGTFSCKSVIVPLSFFTVWHLVRSSSQLLDAVGWVFIKGLTWNRCSHESCWDLQYIVSLLTRLNVNCPARGWMVGCTSDSRFGSCMMCRTISPLLQLQLHLPW